MYVVGTCILELLGMLRGNVYVCNKYILNIMYINNNIV